MDAVRWAILLVAVCVTIVDARTTAGLSYNTPKGGETEEIPPPVIFTLGCLVGETQTEDSEGNLHPDIRTYDGKTVQLFTSNKFSITRNNEDKNDPCRVQVRATTKTDASEVDWVGVSFGAHGNQDKFQNNLALGRGRDENGDPVVEIRGSGYPDAERIEVPFTWRSSDEQTEVTVKKTDEADIVVEGYALSGSDCIFKVTYGLTDNPLRGAFRVELTNDYSSEVWGMCGSPDGDGKNDLKKPNGDIVPDNEEGHRDLSDSWIDGTHQWGGH